MAYHQLLRRGQDAVGAIRVGLHLPCPVSPRGITGTCSRAG